MPSLPLAFQATRPCSTVDRGQRGVLAPKESGRACRAGDHLQLPPTVVSDKAAKAGLSRTLFERLHGLFGEAISQMLTMQYRMHQSIMSWSSTALYHGRMTAHASVAEHTIATLAAVGVDAADDDAVSPLIVVDTAGCGMEERQEEEGGSRFNEGEATCVRLLVCELQAAQVPLDCVGVITPYSAQRSRYAPFARRSGSAASLWLPRAQNVCYSDDTAAEPASVSPYVLKRVALHAGSRLTSARPAFQPLR